MSNPIIKQITINNHTYDVFDEGARELIQELLNFREYLGITTSTIEEGGTTNPVLIEGEEVTAVAGDVVTRSTDNLEFIFSSTGKWQNFGQLSGLGALAFKNSASGDYTPAGTVSQPSFTGSSLTSSGTFTPEGTVSQPSFTGSEMTSSGTFTPEGSLDGTVLGTKTIKQFKTQGSMPTYSVSNGNLTITDGVLPTGEDVSVGDGTVTTEATFTGTAGSVSVSGTPEGTVSQPSFTGTAGSVSVSGTPEGTVSQPTFTGTQDTIIVE